MNPIRAINLPIPIQETPLHYPNPEPDTAAPAPRAPQDPTAEVPAELRSDTLGSGAADTP